MCGYCRIFVNLTLLDIVGLFFPVGLAEMYSPVSCQLTGPLLGGGCTVHTKAAGSGEGFRGCTKITA